MKGTYWKNITRELAANRSRMLALAAIVMLGAAMLTGLLGIAPDMRYSADRYWDEERLMDLRVVSTLGLTDGDIALIADADGVSGAMPIRSVDCLALNEDGDGLVIRAQSLPADLSAGNADYLNRLTLREGRLPEQPGECAVLTLGITDGVRVGDVIALDEANGEDDDALTEQEFTVVGLVSSPTNFSIDDESSTAGDGKLDAILYMPAEVFDMEVWTGIYLTVEGAAAEDAFGEGYDAKVDPVIDRLEELGEERSDLRRDEVVTDAQKELDEARAEYEEEKAKAEEQIAEAEEELADALKKLEDGERQLADGEKQWKDGVAELAAQKAALPALLTEQREKLAEGRRQVAEGEVALAQAQKQLEEAQAQYEQVADAQEQIEQAEQQLAMAESAVAAAEQALPTLRQAVQSAQNALTRAERQQAEAEAGLAAAQLAYDTALAAMPPEEQRTEEQKAELERLSAALSDAQTEADTARADCENARQVAQDSQALLTRTEEELAAAKTQTEEGRAELEEAKKQMEGLGDLADAPAQFEAAKKQLAESEKELALAKAQVQEGEFALQMAPLEAQLQFELAQDQLDEARKTLDESRAELDDGWKEYNKGMDTFQKEKADAEQQLLEAEDKLLDAQLEIDRIEDCEWYVLGRDTVVPCVTFESNAEKLEAVARVFPVFFYLVAALVALTTMTRMVDENRTQIGTLKALGYGEWAITFKYLLYALLASLAGGAVGVVLGTQALPRVLWFAYSIMYRLPKFYALVDPALTFVSLAAGALATGVATASACTATLSERPARLLMPKAPPAGKRILLEHITPIWRRLKFTHKVTARNLFRYKKRMIMTVTGIAGCTALLLVGFGLQDSIMDLVNTQYSQLWHYDVSIGIDREDALTSRRGAGPILDDGERIADWTRIHAKTVDVTGPDGLTKTVNLTVPKAARDFDAFVTLRDPDSGRELEFSGRSAVLTAKTAEELGVQAGDPVTAEIEGKRVTVTLTGIAENYLGVGLYLGADLYADALGSEAEWNTVYAIAAEGADFDALATDLLGADYVSSVMFSRDTAKIFDETIKNINSVVVVIILCAGMLAFVVLYNLISINIGERKKELATIKVLGFYENEVGMYIFREIFLLALMGGAAGLVLGVPLHQFVIRAVEVDGMMFVRQVAPTSYLFSMVLTMVFTAVVCLWTRRSLRTIDMVESLKAPE